MLTRSLHVLLWLGFALAVGLFAMLAVRTVPSPRLEAVENVVLDQALQLAKHEVPYREAVGTAPSLMPGYPLVVSVLVAGFGPGAWAPRSLTLIAILLAAGMVAMVIRNETDSWTLGATGAGIVVGGFALLVPQPGAVGAEAIMLALVLGGCLALRDLEGALGAFFAAVLLAAACFTHPQGIWFAVGGMAYLAVVDRFRRLLPYTIAIAVFGGGGYVLFSFLMGPGFNEQAWRGSIGSIAFNPSALQSFAGQMFGTLGVVTLGAVLQLTLPEFSWRGSCGVWTCMSLAGLASGLLATQSTTAGPQAALPALTVLAILGPVALQQVTQHLSTWPGSARMGGQRVLLFTLVLQFVALFSRVSLSHFSPTS